MNPRPKLRIILKSGAAIECYCDSFDYGFTGRRLATFEIQNPAPNIGFIDLDSVAAIIELGKRQ